MLHAEARARQPPFHGSGRDHTTWGAGLARRIHGKPLLVRGRSWALLVQGPFRFRTTMADHPPAARRAILRRLKDGEHPADLVADARRIGDPGHAATALLHLACDPRLPATKAASLVREATRELKKVDRPGRYAEAWGEALAVVDGLDRGPEAAQALDDLEASAAASIRKMPDGTWVAQAVLAVLPHVQGEPRERLLARGLKSDGAREVAKAAVDLDPGLIDTVKEHASADVLAAVQARAGDKDAAVDAAWSIEEAPERREAMRVLIWQMESVDALMSIGASADSQSAADRCAIWTMVAGRLDRLGHDASQAFGAAKKALADLHGKDAVKAYRKLAQAMERAGLEAPPPSHEDPDAPEQAEPTVDEVDGEEAASPAEVTDGPDAAEPDPAPPEAEAGPTGQAEPATRPPGPRHTFGLIDGYTGSLGPAHLRAVARAAPLCIAFDLDLALVGFPGDLSTIVDLVEVDTNVGEGGGYAKRLLDEGRIRFMDADALPAFPGRVIATTPHPSPDKQGALEGERILLLVGLGKQGIPKGVLDRVDVHHELTGQGISLETATAMGILADRLGRA